MKTVEDTSPPPLPRISALEAKRILAESRETVESLTTWLTRLVRAGADGQSIEEPTLMEELTLNKRCIGHIVVIQWDTFYNFEYIREREIVE